MSLEFALLQGVERMPVRFNCIGLVSLVLKLNFGRDITALKHVTSANYPKT